MQTLAILNIEDPEIQFAKDFLMQEHFQKGKIEQKLDQMLKFPTLVEE